MDDFLHNLRTGKNKPFDRNRKQFDNNGFKNTDRQNPNDNRRKDAFQRTPPVDHFPALKLLLGDIAEGQKRLATIDERRAAAEERVAAALERIASSFIQEKMAVNPVHTIAPELKAAQAVSETIKSDADVLPRVNRQGVLEMIGAMRKELMSYEKIARTLEAQGIPTFSGKGAWHSQTVSKLCYQLQASQG